MATDCYKKFKTVFNQGIADGLTSLVATAAAQSAMDACLALQNSTTATVAQPITVVNGGRQTDNGPTLPPVSST